MPIPKDILRDNPCLSDWSILTAYRGSIAHGMYMPKNDPNSIDDKDAIAICIPPVDYYYGLKEFGSRGTKEIKINEWDIVVFEFVKALRLLKAGNPNILNILWLEPQYYIKITPSGQLLLDNRDLFAAKHVYHSFVGYARGQLHRMTHLACKGYMGKKRKALVEKFGYDTKNAAHCIRILKMGIEFLTDGRLQVQRKDAGYLLEIKRGGWSLEAVKLEAERLFISAETAFINSKLPFLPDKEKINKLCINMAEILLYHKYKAR